MLITREILEQQEKNNLAGYACLSASSKGRVVPQQEPPFRTCFQRDRDRILHSTAFRRLEYKTQVFINYESDHYRTRLTHTLEVAQIGRSISLAVGANVDLTEAICLVHDIGHPPFGHAGEHILDQFMKNYGGIEHNHQSYRVVTQLENKYPNLSGLNLTYETLEGILKHETKLELPQNSFIDPNLRAHIEAQITDQSDSLAYTAHDLDDGLRSGMLTPDMLNNVDLWKIATEGILHPDSCTPLTDLQRHQVIRQLIGHEVQSLIKSTENNLIENGVESVDDLRRLPYNVVRFDEPLNTYNQQMKTFLYENLYYHYRVMRMTFKAEKIITELFQSYKNKPAILPTHIKENIERYGLERTICDYIAGMTDRFAIDEYQKIFDPTFIP